MKKVLLLVAVVVLSANTALAQNARVGLFRDLTGTDCTSDDVAPGLLNIFAVVIMTAGNSACEFQATMPACMIGASFLADGKPWPITLGDSQAGVSVAYGLCDPAPTHVLTLQFFVAGLTSPCCIYPVTPHPFAGIPGEVVVEDCTNLVIADGQSGVVNSMLGCECADIVAAHHSSWGQIKALYR